MVAESGAPGRGGGGCCSRPGGRCTCVRGGGCWAMLVGGEGTQEGDGSGELLVLIKDEQSFNCAHDSTTVTCSPCGGWLGSSRRAVGVNSSPRGRAVARALSHDAPSTDIPAALVSNPPYRTNVLKPTRIHTPAWPSKPHPQPSKRR